MRLATFNILHGRSPVDGRVDPARLRAAIQELDADILALQEVDRGQPRSHLLDLAEVAAEAMTAASRRFVPALAGRLDQDWRAATDQEAPDQPGYGIALLTRQPVSDWRVVRLPPPTPEPRPPGGARRSTPVDDEARVAMIGRVDSPVGPVTVVNTHLSFVEAVARRQLRHLVEQLESCPEPLVLLGDLNLPPAAVGAVTGYLPLATHLTYPADAPTEQIDHILLRGRLGGATASEAPRLGLSDHRPLVVTLR